MSLREIRWIDLPHVPDERGGHAHRDTRQILLAVAGQFTVDASNGSESRTFSMNDPNRALYVPSLTWIRLYAFEPRAVCLVLADRAYADTTYIRDWNQFVGMAR